MGRAKASGRVPRRRRSLPAPDFQALLASALAATEPAGSDAERANRLKNDFLSLVSHELRTPVTTLLLQLHLLRRERPEDAVVAGHARVMEVAARRLLAFVEELIEHAEIRRGRLAVRRERLDLAALAREVALEAGREGAKKEIEVRVVAPTPVWMWSDARLVRLVVWHLVSNAVKFTPRGHVEVSVTDGGGVHHVRVEDSGPGIPAADRQRIFEPFEQLVPVRNKHEGGAGLGLTLVRDVVQALGGSVRVESDEHGSAFTVELPSAPEVSRDV